MKVTTWELDEDVRLRYDHASDEIYIEEARVVHSKLTYERLFLGKGMVVDLATALRELQQMLGRAA